MTSAITLFELKSNLNHWHPFQNWNESEHNEASETAKELPEVLFITSFPPRECGIATYSHDLIEALTNQFKNSFSVGVCALESNNEQHTYPKKPQFILNTDCRNSFAKTAFAISKESKIKLVVIQHEFGFFAKNKEEFVGMIEHIQQPIIIVFHTVLPHPNEDLKLEIQNLTDLASSVVVMTKNAANILQNQYDIHEYKITIIPHGTHLVPPTDRKQLKAKYDFSNKKILSTFGLLGSSKNIETTLEALPKIVEQQPDVLFLVLGKTHPTIFKNEGEKYRQMLEEKVKTLKIGSHVKFINEYLQLNTLLEYLLLTDVYLFTSKDPNQAVSGTFSYAVSCGCPVVSTPIPHAKEVLSNQSGIIIDFENPTQLSEAVISLLDNDNLRAEISSNSLHRMASTAWQNSAIAHAMLFEELSSNTIGLEYKWPKINLNHIQKMTTDVGMIQFSKIAMPDFNTGYTLDDNARALIVMAQNYELFGNKNDLKMLNTYLQFIRFCMQPDGTFLNYVDKNNLFTRQNYDENLQDSNGRAIWALGYLVSLKEILPTYLSNIAEHLIEKALPNLSQIHSTRAMAFIIKGLHYQNKTENLGLIEKFAKRLKQMYKHEKTDGWFWFENYLTYGNSLLPEAMLCAYQSTENDNYKLIALESFDFLLSNIFDGNKIKVVSNKGWLIKDRNMDKPIGGEQPIDVAYTIMALEKFYMEFKNEQYKQDAYMAFNWFLGNNHLNQIVYNPCTGGCYDGVEEHNVNLNQGAESTLSYLMARLSVQRMSDLETHYSENIINLKMLVDELF